VLCSPGTTEDQHGPEVDSSTVQHSYQGETAIASHQNLGQELRRRRALRHGWLYRRHALDEHLDVGRGHSLTWLRHLVNDNAVAIDRPTADSIGLDAESLLRCAGLRDAQREPHHRRCHTLNDRW